MCIDIEKELFSKQIKEFIGENETIEESGHSGAITIYIIKDQGYFLKIFGVNCLKDDYERLVYFSNLKLAPKPILYLTDDKYDYLITEKSRGLNCVNDKFLNEPENLAKVLGKILRNFHEKYQNYKCPFSYTKYEILDKVKENFQNNKFNVRQMEYNNVKDIRKVYDYVINNINLLKDDALIHGDYCLPNILLDDKMNFIHFIDLNQAGRGDRHYDLYWGSWSLAYNLNTKKYQDIFFESYGLDKIDTVRLKLIGYIACLEG